MADAISYRFYPWVRRGLSSALLPADPPPAHGQVRVKITVTPEIVAHCDVKLLGPGDVIGIDRRLIVRTEPRGRSLDFEPNYMAAVEFDAPELPWLFTPTGAGPDGRLRPWLVLVVLDSSLVKAPRVTATRPLPFIKVPGALVASELPNLDDSWAWAHSQRVVHDGEDDARALESSPDLNVSRLVAPRRLVPDRSWLACVVPAFDAGVAAGLGIARQNPAAPLGPAWRTGIDAELPVYYHWEFQTGDFGDFEYLARKLTPMRVSAKDRTEDAKRRARAFLGTADGLADTLAAMPVNSVEGPTGGYTRLDAPLEMLDQGAAKVDDMPAPFSSAAARATAARSSASQLSAAAADDLPAPLYGDRFAQRDSATPADRAQFWFDELNLDARTRVAARLGGDTVRRFQEELMEASWAQIGDVLAANTQIGRSRFLTLVAMRALERHVIGLSGPRVMALTAHMHARLRADDLTVAARIARTSLADAAFDPALRRMTSPVGRLARAVARRAAPDVRATLRRSLSHGIAQALQAHPGVIDPSVAPREGVGVYTLDPTPRDDLETIGILTDVHRRAVLEAARDTGESPITVLRNLHRAARDAPQALHFAVRRAQSGQTGGVVVAIESDGAGALTMFDPHTRERTPLLRMNVLGSPNPQLLSNVLTNMPTAVLAEGTHSAIVAGPPGASRVAFEIREERSGPAPRVFDEAAIARDARLFTAVIPPPNRDLAVVRATKSALQNLAAVQPALPPELPVVRAMIATSSVGLPASVQVAIEPATLFRRRAMSMVAIPDWIRDGATDIFEPIMRAPVLRMPFAELLTRLAPLDFLPRDVEIPDNSITALTTNQRFVTAFMVGANHEMNRELLWRTFPSDGRGTPIQRFWNWIDPQRSDVTAIHQWPTAAPLRARAASGTPLVTLAFRGRLLRRYPNTAVLIWKANGRGVLADVPQGDAVQRRTVLREHLFKLPIEPDLTVVGFDIKVEEFLDQTNGGWYVVLQEPVTEPRLGLDESDSLRPRFKPRNRNDRAWAQTAPGQHLRALNAELGAPGNSAEIANELLQRPVRMAIHATQIAPTL